MEQINIDNIALAIQTSAFIVIDSIWYRIQGHSIECMELTSEEPCIYYYSDDELQSEHSASFSETVDMVNAYNVKFYKCVEVDLYGTN